MIDSQRTVDELIQSSVKYGPDGDQVQLMARVIDGELSKITLRFVSVSGDTSTAAMCPRTHFGGATGAYTTPNLRDTMSAMREAIDELVAELDARHNGKEHTDEA